MARDRERRPRGRLVSAKGAVARAQELDEDDFLARLRLLDEEIDGATLGARRAGHALAHAALAAAEAAGVAGRSPRVGIQGFGTLGRAAAVALTEAGVTPSAVTDEHTCLHCHAHPRQTVADACAAVAASGVLSPSGHGNFSCRVDPQRMLLTGADMSAVPHVEDLALVGLDGLVEEGQLLASVTETVGMHAAVYRARPGVGAVVHTHSPAVTAFALAHHALPCRYEALLRHGQAEPVPVVGWAPRGSPALVDGLTQALRAHPRTWALLLANHGLLAFAPTPQRAASLVIALEEAARAELAAASLGGAKGFPSGALEQVQASMAASPGEAPAGRAAWR